MQFVTLRRVLLLLPWGMVLEVGALQNPSLGQFILCLFSDINKLCGVLLRPGEMIVLDFTLEYSLVLVPDQAVSQRQHQITLSR